MDGNQLSIIDSYQDNTMCQNIISMISENINPLFLKSAHFVLNAGSTTTPYSSLVIHASESVYRDSSKNGALFARLKLSGKLPYISISQVYKKLLDTYGINYSKIKSDSFLRIDVNEFLKLCNSSAAKLIFEEIFLKSFNYSAFGCCDRYKKCSAADHCVHDDILYASVACQYKKNLDNGKVFY